MTKEELNTIEALADEAINDSYAGTCIMDSLDDIAPLIAEVRRLQGEGIKFKPMDGSFPKNDYNLIKFEQRGLVKCAVVKWVTADWHVFGGGLVSVKYDDEEILGWSALPND